MILDSKRILKDFINLRRCLILHIREDMRVSIQGYGSATGWDNKPTRNPTSCMMTIKFMGVLVVRIRGAWYFTVPLTDELEQYVRALGLDEDLLPGRGPDDAGKKRDQKLTGERR